MMEKDLLKNNLSGPEGPVLTELNNEFFVNMDGFCFRITTHDRTVLTRWQAAFKKEGWEARTFDCPETLPLAGGQAELDLVEVGTPLCRTPEDLHRVIETRKPVATLAFAAHRNISNSQIVRYLESGADDFVFSDTDERVIVAKLKAYIRRLTPAISRTLTKLVSSNGDMLIDQTKRVVKIRVTHGRYTELLNLTQKELEILSLLIGNERRPVSRERMLERLWGDDATEVYSDCINKHIETLRRKLGPYSKRIKTVYGSGYMFM